MTLIAIDIQKWCMLLLLIAVSSCTTVTDNSEKNKKQKISHKKQLSALYSSGNTTDLNLTKLEQEQNKTRILWKMEPPVITKDDRIFVATGDIQLAADLVQNYLIVKNFTHEDMWVTLQKFVEFNGFRNVQEDVSKGLLTTHYVRRIDLVPREYVNLLARALYDYQPVNTTNYL